MNLSFDHNDKWWYLIKNLWKQVCRMSGFWNVPSWIKTVTPPHLPVIKKYILPMNLVANTKSSHILIYYKAKLVYSKTDQSMYFIKWINNNKRVSKLKWFLLLVAETGPASDTPWIVRVSGPAEVLCPINFFSELFWWVEILYKKIG